MEHDSESLFNDCADWHRAATWHTPVDELEPLPANPSEYREAAVRLIRGSCIVWTPSSVAPATPGLRISRFQSRWALCSTRGRTVTDIAEEIGITKQALSRGVAKFLRMAQIEPAFGLKSNEARRTYQNCH